MSEISPTSKVTVILDDQGDQTTLDAPREKSLLETLKKHNIYVKSSCGGVASCGDCIVKVLSGADNISPAGFDETKLLGNVFHITGERLSCQSKITGGVTIDVSHQDRKRDQEELKNRTSKTSPRRHKVRTRQESESLKRERSEQSEKERSWERHWEKGPGRKGSGASKQGGHHRPRPFRTDHLDEDDR